MGRKPSAATERKVTLADIAAHLGLDKSTISLALSGSDKISAETKERVKLLAQKLGYQPNVAARQLRKGGHLAIGLAMPSSFEALGSHFTVRAIQEIAKLAFERGVIFAILPTPGGSSGAACQNPFLPDGVMAWGDVPLDEVRPMLGNGRPFVVLDPNHPSYQGFNGAAIRIDNAGGAKAIVKRLAGRGAERLLFVKTRQGHIGHDERWEGARAAWLRVRPLHKISSCLLEELTDERLKSFVSERGGAIFCSNDHGAAEVWHRLARLGARAPEDVALAGFDGDPYGRNFDLTTVEVDSRALAGMAFDALSDAMDGRPSAKLSRTLPVALRPGGTS